MKKALMVLAFVLCIPSMGHSILGVGDTAVVFDPTNYQMNLLTQANTLKSTLNEALMIQNQAKGLQYQLQGLWNQATNLQKSPLQLLGQIQGLWMSYQSLLKRANGLTYELDTTRQRFETTYPSLPRSNLNTITQEAAAMRTSIRAASQTATDTQSIYDRLGQQMAHNNQALSAAQASVGALQVEQAQAQLTALSNEQLAGIAEIEAAGNRVNTEWIAMQMKERQDGEAVNAKFMAGYGGQGFKGVGATKGVELK